MVLLYAILLSYCVTGPPSPPSVTVDADERHVFHTCQAAQSGLTRPIKVYGRAAGPSVSLMDSYPQPPATPIPNPPSPTHAPADARPGDRRFSKRRGGISSGHCLVLPFHFHQMIVSVRRVITYWKYCIWFTVRSHG